jgi:hypothetical protein
MDAVVGILLAAVLAAALVWSLRDAARDPQPTPLATSAMVDLGRDRCRRTWRVSRGRF